MSRKISDYMQALFSEMFSEAIPLEDALQEINLRDIIIYYTPGVKIQKGAAPCTDGKTVFLQPSKKLFMDARSTDPETLASNRNVHLYRSDIAHEIAHLIEGSFLIDISESAKKFKNPGLASRLLNIVEDVRIEYKIRRHGTKYDALIREDLEWSNHIYVYKNPTPQKDGTHFIQMMLTQTLIGRTRAEAVRELVEEDGEQKFQDTYCRIDEEDREKMKEKLGIDDDELEQKIQKTWEEILKLENDLLGAKVGEELSDRFDTRRDLMEYCVQLVRSVKGMDKEVYDSVEAMKELYDLISKEFPELEQDGQEGANGRPTTNIDYTKPQSGVDEKFVPKPEKADIDNLDEETKQKIRQKLEEYLKKNATKFAKDKEPRKRPEPKKKPEKREEDYSHKVFQYNPENHCDNIPITVHHDFAKERDREFVKTLAGYRWITRLLETYLENLQLNEVQRQNKPMQPGMILNPTRHALITADAKLALEMNSYDTLLIQERNYGVYFLIDRSGSTSHEVSAERFKGCECILDLEKITAGCLVQALQKFGLTSEIALFDDWQETTITHATLDTLGRLKPCSANRDGAAVRGMTKYILSRTPDKENYLFMLSDGFPASDNYDGEPAAIDTGRAIRDAVRRGIKAAYFLVRTESQMNPKSIKLYDLITEHATSKAIIHNPEQIPRAVQKSVLKYLQ